MTEPTDIRRARPVRREPDADIISMLEGALDSAKRGEIVDCVIITANPKSYDYDYKLNSDGFGIAGYMIRVQQEIVADQDD